MEYGLPLNTKVAKLMKIVESTLDNEQLIVGSCHIKRLKRYTSLGIIDF